MVRWILKCSAIGSSSLSHLQKSKNFSKRHFPDNVLPMVTLHAKVRVEGGFLNQQRNGDKDGEKRHK